MPSIKVRCPECDANIRHPATAVSKPTDLTITCPKCSTEFLARVEPDQFAKPGKHTEDEDRRDKPGGKKAGKSSRPRHLDDDHDDSPRKKKKKKAEANYQKLIIGGAGGGGVLISAIVAVVLALGGKDKNPDDDLADLPDDNIGAGAGMPGPANDGAAVPGPVTPGPVTPGPVTPGPTGNNGTGGFVLPFGDGNTTLPPKKDSTIPPPPPGAKLPDPPVIRISGSLAPTGPLTTPVERPPASPPLSPDEDPFVRAKKYVLTAQLPQLPKLPPPAQRPLLTLDPGGHSAFVQHLFVTPNGDQVITVGKDKAIRLWDIATGEAVRTIRLPAGLTDEGELQAASMSPDGKRLAVAGKPLKALKRKGAVPVFIIDLETGALVKTLTASRGDEVTALDFSNDGKRMAIGCSDGHVEVITIASGVKFRDGQAHQVDVRQVRYSPTPKTDILATIGADAVVRIIDLTPGRPVQALSVQATRLLPTDIAWSHDGRTLAVSSDTGDILLFHATGQLSRTLRAHTMEIKDEEKSTTRTVTMTNVRFLPGDREVACCGNAGAPGWAGVKNAESGAIRVQHKLHTNTMSAMCVSADGNRVVTSGGNQYETYVWEAKSGKIISRLCGSGNGMWSVGWAKDGKSIAYGISNKGNPDGSRPIDFTFLFDDFGPGPAADPAKYQLLMQSDGAYRCERVSAQIWAVGPGNGQPRPIILEPEDGPIYSATVIPGRRMAVAAAAFALKLIDPQTGRPIREFRGHTGNVVSVAPSPDGKYFVTGSADQTIRIWMPELEDPVMSIFVGGGEWIAWTPQGFYSCSGNGERLVAWQVNSGPTRLPQVHPAERFRPSMYQPAIIKYLIPSGNMGLALAMAKHYDKALVQATNIADILPPEITLVTPEVEKKDVIVDQDTITVKAVANGNKQPITAMRLLVDGRPFEGTKGIRTFADPKTEAEATWEVPLTAGPHSFAVIAESPVSKGMSKMAVVTRAGEPPRPNLYVLAVGVSEYAPPMKLNFAASDAKLLAKTFAAKSKDLYENVEIRTLTDADATLKKIREGMDWLKSKMTAKDVGIVVFSGHGGRDPFSGKFFLIPVDITEDMETSGLSGDEFKSRMQNMPGRLVAIMDACHSGSVADAQKREQARPDGLVRDLVAEESGVIVMCSSLGREYSLESSLTQAGFYTLGLVEGMNGHGDVDQDGIVYINELDMYANARVKQLSAGAQNPTVGRPPSIRPFPIAKP